MSRLAMLVVATSMISLAACRGLRSGPEATTTSEPTLARPTGEPSQTAPAAAASGTCFFLEDRARPGWVRCNTEAGSFDVRVPEGSGLAEAAMPPRLHLPISPGTDLVEKYLDVGVLEGAETCPSPDTPGYGFVSRQGSPQTIDGGDVDFIVEEGQDGAMGHSYSWLVYSTSRDRTCVSLILTLVSSSALVPPPPHFGIEEEYAFGGVIASFRWVESSTAGPLSTATALPPRIPGEPVVTFGIHMLDVRNGWAIGRVQEEDGHILRTWDGGWMWEDVTPPEPEEAERSAFPAFFFLDADRAWVCYGRHEAGDAPVVWRTEDAGETWSASHPLDILYPSHLHFADELRGWLLVERDVTPDYVPFDLYRTLDGGATWERIFDPSSAEVGEIFIRSRRNMVFADAQTGVISIGRSESGGPPLLNWTRDGGVTWALVAIDPPAERPELFEDTDFCGVYWPRLFTPLEWAIIVECDAVATETSYRYFYFTRDGGQTWQTSSYPGGRLAMVDPLVGFATGHDLSPRMFPHRYDLHRTGDGGQTWTLIGSVPWDGYFNFVDARNGWAEAWQGATGSLFRTRDGGQTWEELTPVLLP